MTTWTAPSGDGDAAGRPPRRVGRRLIAATVLGVVAVLLVAATMLGHRSSATRAAPATGSAPAPQAAAAAAATGPHLTAGVPVGYQRTEAGARSAATNYAVAYGSAGMFVPSSRHAILGAIADPSVIPGLTAQLDAAFSATEDRFGLDRNGQPVGQDLRFVCRALPVGVRTVTYSPDVAVVAVWAAGLVGLAGPSTVHPVQESWGTTTITLRWVAGDWKWASWSAAEGPTPVVGVQQPSDSSVVADAVAGFGELTYAGR